eukprot:SM005886S18617  [mRNA]  locus=s5886:207:887:+ [translate_table: standard]
MAVLRRPPPLLRRPPSASQQEKKEEEEEEDDDGAAASPSSPGLPARRAGWPLFAKLLAFRLANAVVARTFFNPDEYWQCTEVAHRLAFGYGALTWEWRAGLRGYAHPLVFAVLYRVLAVLGIDTPQLVVGL